ncbi:MAG: DUF3102 domain-containing protein [Magnetococcales bacterium]|nr:DUF3102 domain-containing protein [Magnetococcales bacterium]
MEAEIDGATLEGEILSPPTDVVKTGGKRTVDDFAAWITQSWRESMEGIMETGRRLIEAKKTLPHGEFDAMIESQLPFSRVTALRLRRIAESDRFSNVSPVKHLPTSYSVLYEMLALPQEDFDRLLDSGAINKDTTRNEIIELRKALRNPPNKGGDGEGIDKGAGKKAGKPGVRAVNHPVTYTLRLTHGEGVMLQDLFSTANQLGMVSKWLNERYAQKSKDRPDPNNLMNKFKMLELPELPLFVRD